MAALSRNILANYAGRSWTMLLGILLIPIYIRFIGIEAYGLVGFYTALSSVLGILDLGIGSTMNRELARRSASSDLYGTQRDLVRTLELVYWGISIIVGVIVIVLSPLISSKWLNAQELSPQVICRSVQLMGISLALQFPISLYQGGLIGIQKHVTVNVIIVILSTFRSGGAILILWLISPTINAYFMWQIIISLIGCVIFLITIWNYLPVTQVRAKFRFHIISDIWKYAAAISVNAIIGIILSQLDKVILSKMIPLKMFAYYTIAGTVASAIWVIIIPLNTSIFPYLVQLYEKKQFSDLRLIFHRSSQILSLLLFPVCAILIVFSREILTLWLNDATVVEHSHLIVSLLVFGTMLNGMASLPANCAPAFGWPLIITYTNAIQAIIIVPLVIFLVGWLQGIGAGIAWIIMNSTYIIFMVPFFFKRFLKEEQKKWYINDLFKPAITSFAICLILFFFSPKLNSNTAIFLWLAMTGILTFFLTGMTLPEVRNHIWNKWIKSHNVPI